jgi:hypothetical protein
LATDLHIYLDGDGVHPETAPAEELLALAAAMLRLMRAATEERGGTFNPVGLDVQDGCAAVVTSEPDLPEGSMLRTVERCLAVVRGEESPPRGGTEASRRIQTVVRSLPRGVSAGMQLGTFDRPIALPPPQIIRATATTEMRVRIVGILRPDDPQLRVATAFQEGDFPLDVEEADTTKLLQLFGKEVQARVLVEYSPRFEVTRGKLLEWTELEDNRPLLDVLDALAPRNEGGE